MAAAINRLAGRCYLPHCASSRTIPDWGLARRLFWDSWPTGRRRQFGKHLKTLFGDIQPNGRDLHESPSPDYGEAYRFPQIPGWVHSIRTEHLLKSVEFGGT